MPRQILTGIALAITLSCLCGVAQASGGDAEIRQLRNEAMDAHRKGNDDLALDTYEKAGELTRLYGADSGYLADLLTEMGIVASDGQKPQTAQRYLEEAVRIKPNSIMARVKLSEVLRLRGLPEDAKRQAMAVLQKHNSPLARQALAMAYLDLGNQTQATQQWYYLDQELKGKRAPVPKAPPPPPAAPPQPTAAEKEKAEKAKAEKEKAEQEKAAKAEAEKAKSSAKADKSRADKERADREKAARAAAAKAASVKAAPAPKPEKKPPPAAKPSVPPPPVELRAKPIKVRPGGLVPPPPPVVPMFGGGLPGPPPQFAPPSQPVNLNTEAKVIKKKKKKETEEAGAKEDEDFLLDWAGDKPKKKKKVEEKTEE